jgi:hypothetical protein
MISKEQVDLTITAAKDAAGPEGDFSWVRDSSYLRRAYSCGLYAGLRAIANEEDLNKFLLRVYVETMFTREGDDTFSATPIGKACGDMKKSFESHEKHQSATEALKALFDQLNEAERFWETKLREAKHWLGEIDSILNEPPVSHDSQEGTSDPKYEQKHRRAYTTLEKLEKSMRVLSLIQTDHDRCKPLAE